MSYKHNLALGTLLAVALATTGASDVGCQVPVPEQSGTTSSKPSSSDEFEPEEPDQSDETDGLKNGAINLDVTPDNLEDTICKVGYTKTIRPPVSYTQKIKKKMIADQGWEGPAILDHYIPLQGGGHPSDPRNFLLQTPKDSYIKDTVEDHMHDDICDGKITLRKAQEIMGADWTKYDERAR
jgi:hypothetical protein